MTVECWHESSISAVSMLERDETWIIFVLWVYIVVNELC